MTCAIDLCAISMQWTVRFDGRGFRSVVHLVFPLSNPIFLVWHRRVHIKFLLDGLLSDIRREIAFFGLVSKSDGQERQLVVSDIGRLLPTN